MSTYTPDHWVVLEMKYGDETIRKIFSGWSGSYLYGASWKLSSGITKVNEFEDRYEFENFSGSLYVCRKNAYGMSGYMMSVFSSFEEDVKNSENVSMEIVKEYDVQTRTEL